MKLLLTGICGFVGSTLASALRKSHPDWDLVGIDNFCRAGSALNRHLIERELQIEFHHGDIRSPSDIAALPACDHVLDAAANPTVLAGIDGKTSSRQLVEHNLAGTVNLLEYCKEHSAGFTLLSTSRVYSIAELARFPVELSSGGPATAPLGGPLDRYHPVPGSSLPLGLSENGISEALSTSPPVSLYGSTKVASEHLALEYGGLFDFPVWINRCGVLAGAGQFAHPTQGLFGFWIHSFREGRPLHYLGFDGLGHQVRVALHPRDLLPLLERQFAETAASKKPRIANLGGGNTRSASLAELTAWCRARFPASSTVIPEPDGPPQIRPFDLPWVVMDTALARETWCWSPATSVAEMCDEIASFADEHPEWLSLTS